MKIDVHHYFHNVPADAEIIRLLKVLIQQGEKNVATQAELAATLATVKAQLTKAAAEISAKIQALVDAAANAANVDPALQLAVDDMVPIGQQLDDIVPDAP